MQIMEIILPNNSNSVYAENTRFFKLKDKVVVSVNGGLELGTVKSFKNSTDEELVEVVRPANQTDLQQNCENCKYCRSILAEIKQEAENLGLNMKISFVSTNLDRSKHLISYTADDRVDFRELVKILGAKYKTRVEMRQIGNRDETKVVGAMGVCGRVTCCKAYLSDFDKVSIKMAKNQNISLNPTRINGMCGRLLCCLKYEDEYYEEMQKKMPKMNTYVTTPDGKGVVSYLDFLKEKVTVTFTKDESTEVKIYDLADVKFGAKDKNEQDR